MSQNLFIEHNQTGAYGKLRDVCGLVVNRRFVRRINVNEVVLVKGQYAVTAFTAFDAFVCVNAISF